MIMYDMSFLVEYFHQLRMLKRGDINILSDCFRDIEEMEKLVNIALVEDNYLCSACHLIFMEVNDYYEYLPLIVTGKDGNINIFCNKKRCREEAMVFVKENK